MKTLIIKEKKMLFGLITQRSGVRITLPLPRLNLGGTFKVGEWKNNSWTSDFVEGQVSSGNVKVGKTIIGGEVSSGVYNAKANIDRAAFGNWFSDFMQACQDYMKDSYNRVTKPQNYIIKEQ